MKLSKLVGLLSALVLVVAMAIVVISAVSIAMVSFQPGQQSSSGASLTIVNRGFLPVKVAIGLRGPSGSPQFYQIAEATIQPSSEVTEQIVLANLPSGMSLSNLENSSLVALVSPMGLLQAGVSIPASELIQQYGGGLLGNGGINVTDLKVGTPSIESATQSNVSAVIPFSFVDASSVPLRATLSAIVYSGTTQVGSGSTYVSAQPKQTFNGELPLTLDVNTTGLFMEGGSFNYDVYADGVQVHSGSFNIQPIFANPSASNFTVRQINSSYSNVSFDFSFYNYYSQPLNVSLTPVAIADGNTYEGQEVAFVVTPAINGQPSVNSYDMSMIVPSAQATSLQLYVKATAFGVPVTVPVPVPAGGI